MTEVFGDASRDGDWAAVRLRLDSDRIVDADADGLEETLRGLTLLEAAAVGGEDLPVEALAAAIGPVFGAPASRSRIAVAMSGGVDSAVALLRAGRGAIGVTLRLWIDPAAPAGERACCSPDAVRAARAACHRLGLPHVTLDLREEFRAAVVEPFVRGYAAGETPNPCTRCNGGFRFAELLAFRRRAGAAVLWTGHYARVVRHRGRLLLGRGADPAKDQSYMLAGVDPGALRHVGFPLGDQTKAETRAEAEAARLLAARRPESQEACFLGGDDYRTFLARRGIEARTGPLVDEDGTILGSHQGHWRFTPGQRRGLGIATGEPAYVLRTIPEQNRVVVGRRSSLSCRSVVTRGVLFIPVSRAEVKLRYRSAAVPAAVAPFPGGFRLDLDRPAFAVARGQTAVLYEDDAVVGWGEIAAAPAAAT
jgi:tRNA-specific 2-thiouridylase